MKLHALAAGLCVSMAASLWAAAPLRMALPQRPPIAGSGTGFTPDKGKFRILQDGSEVGIEDFELSQSGGAWIARGEAVIRVPGSPETRSTGQLHLAADGTPIRYEWSSQTPKKASGTATFERGLAKTSISIEGKDYHEDFQFPSPRVAILDNNLYDQYAILSRLYDWNAKGAQSFPVLIPQDMTPGSITVESIGSRTVDGASFEALRMRTSDLEIDLYFDAGHRLMRLEVPAAKVIVVRQ